MWFIELGERLALKNEKLRDFVADKEGQNFKRNERAVEREARNID